MPTYPLAVQNSQWKALLDALLSADTVAIANAETAFKNYFAALDPVTVKQQMNVLMAASQGSANTISSIQAAHDAGTKSAWQS